MHHVLRRPRARCPLAVLVLQRDIVHGSVEASECDIVGRRAHENKVTNVRVGDVRDKVENLLLSGVAHCPQATELALIGRLARAGSRRRGGCWPSWGLKSKKRGVQMRRAVLRTLPSISILSLSLTIAQSGSGRLVSATAARRET